jgi:YegS/Rv2252/BmrU family lipid kinase
MAKAKVIVNPAAGAGKTAKKWPKVKELLEGMKLDFDFEITEAPGHGMEMAKAAGKKGYEFIVSVGGDGTIHEIANGLYQAGVATEVPVGIVNTGTGADYIRTIGVPRRYKEACQCLLSPNRRTVDLGVIEYTRKGKREKRLFVNFAGIGFDAEVVRATTEKFKSLGSMPSYLMGLLSTLASYENRDVKIIVDGEAGERRICTVMLNNGRYGGGGMKPAPDADPGDGFFDLMIIDDITKPDLLVSIPRIYSGTHGTHPKVTLMRAKEVEIHPTQNSAVQADGELLGEAPARFSILPAALNIIVE